MIVSAFLMLAHFRNNCTAKGYECHNVIYTVNIVLHLNFEDFIAFNYSTPTIKLFT